MLAIAREITLSNSPSKLSGTNWMAAILADTPLVVVAVYLNTTRAHHCQDTVGSLTTALTAFGHMAIALLGDFNMPPQQASELFSRMLRREVKPWAPTVPTTTNNTILDYVLLVGMDTLMVPPTVHTRSIFAMSVTLVPCDA